MQGRIAVVVGEVEARHLLLLRCPTKRVVPSRLYLACTGEAPLYGDGASSLAAARRLHSLWRIVKGGALLILQWRMEGLAVLEVDVWLYSASEW